MNAPWLWLLAFVGGAVIYLAVVHPILSRAACRRWDQMQATMRSTATIVQFPRRSDDGEAAD